MGSQLSLQHTRHKEMQLQEADSVRRQGYLQHYESIKRNYTLASGNGGSYTDHAACQLSKYSISIKHINQDFIDPHSSYDYSNKITNSPQNDSSIIYNMTFKHQMKHSITC